MAPQCLVVDLGGGSIKFGLSSVKVPRCVDNCIYKSKNVTGRNFIGSEIEECKNLSSLFGIYPFKKGYINNWDTQKQILDSVLCRYINSRSLDMASLNLFITEPYFNFTSTKETMNELFFEEYRVAGLLRTNPAFFAAYKYRAESSQRLSRYSLIIDSGYSFTHILPMADGNIMREFALRYNKTFEFIFTRLSVGGKILTNRLIEVTSYRQLDVRSEVYIMNQCKEDGCFVSTDFWADLTCAKSRDLSVNTIAREYVLPDYIDVHRGYLRDPSEKPKDAVDRTKLQGYILRLSNERFTVPELLFHPSDVGYTEMGISEAAQYLLTERLPPGVRPGAMANVLLIGGNSKFSGYKERVLNDLRSCVPHDLPVNVCAPPELLGRLLQRRHETYCARCELSKCRCMQAVFKAARVMGVQEEEEVEAEEAKGGRGGVLRIWTSLPAGKSAAATQSAYYPQLYAWQGGALLASNRDDFDQYLVTRREYEENGHAYCESRFPVT
ncbi:Actin-related protein 6 [Echinococcus granulosus]|uniref:Actin-related protein 6 n=1 Tax=Echinococcus granulosus TaxID=6210 RepID=W6UN69_ECHGR|nr:Actin-related protein 6 [Echinococcus granulosus]EUB59632.1 Actin-related protein 6 [Echinococcus granulosus]